MTESQYMKSTKLRRLFGKKTSSSGWPAKYEKGPDSPSLPAHHPHEINLSQDILILIFDLIQAVSPRTLQALSLVNWTFYHLTSHARTRNVRLDLRPSELQASHDRLKVIERQNLLSAVYILEVVDLGSRPYHSLDKIDPFAPSAVNYRNCQQMIAKLMPLMTGLKILHYKDFDWRDPCIPDCVLEALQGCPKVQLHTHAGGSLLNTTGGLGILTKLRSNANLSQLKVSASYHSEEDWLNVTQPLRKLLSSAPALRSLTLDFHHITWGCMVRSPPAPYCGLGFIVKDSLPALEELVLLCYPWGFAPGHTGYHHGMRIVSQTNYPGYVHEIDYWTECFDWSSLRRLQTSCIAFALKAMPKLTSLREVDFTSFNGGNESIRFYEECPTILEAIGIGDFRGITLEGILRHGANLRSLRIHTVESDEWAQNAMDDISLRAIRDSCPHIEELFLDVPRSGDWPWSTFDILASFPKLRDLTICFELGIHKNSDIVEPYVTFSSVRTIFTYLLKSTVSSTARRLTRLRIICGSPYPVGYDNYRTHSGSWPRYNGVEFICTLSERDDEAADRIFEIVCPSIIDKEKAIKKGLEVSARYTEASTMREIRKIAITAATEGPTPREKWKDYFGNPGLPERTGRECPYLEGRIA